METLLALPRSITMSLSEGKDWRSAWEILEYRAVFDTRECVDTGSEVEPDLFSGHGDCCVVVSLFRGVVSCFISVIGKLSR